MLADYFSTLQFWHWWVLALILVIIEMVAPGFFLFWVGLAAAVTGLVVFIFPATPWQAEFLIFGGLAVASVVAAKFYFRGHPIESADATLNRRGEQHIGRVYNLDEAIINGIGKVRVGDSVWRAVGPDLPAGERVKVVGVEGTMLKVEKA
jgi:hypothetical protein